MELGPAHSEPLARACQLALAGMEGVEPYSDASGVKIAVSDVGGVYIELTGVAVRFFPIWRRHCRELAAQGTFHWGGIDGGYAISFRPAPPQ